MNPAINASVDGGMGGKPNPGTKPDKRLKGNKATTPAPKANPFPPKKGK